MKHFEGTRALAGSDSLSAVFRAALNRFSELRQHPGFVWRKKPGTSELLDWLKEVQAGVEAGQWTPNRPKGGGNWAIKYLNGCAPAQLPYLAALVKTKTDWDAVAKLTSTVEAGGMRP